MDTPQRALHNKKGSRRRAQAQNSSKATLRSTKQTQSQPKPNMKSKERMYIVGSGVSLHMMEDSFSSPQENKNHTTDQQPLGDPNREWHRPFHKEAMFYFIFSEERDDDSQSKQLNQCAYGAERLRHSQARTCEWTPLHGKEECLRPPPSCGLESCAVDVGASWEGGTVTPQGGDQRGVDRKLNPTEHGQPVRHDFQPPCIAWFAATSMSLTKTFVVTRAPPSLHTLAAALSTANPRLPNTPALAQAARWWPRESSGRPHRQMRLDMERGRRRRRNKRVRNRCGSIRVSTPVGHTVNGAPTPGPP